MPAIVKATPTVEVVARDIGISYDDHPLEEVKTAPKEATLVLKTMVSPS
jgi:hypothetical protein